MTVNRIKCANTWFSQLESWIQNKFVHFRRTGATSGNADFLGARCK